LNDEDIDNAIEKLKGQPLNTAQVSAVFKLITERRLPNTLFSFADVKFDNCSDDQVDVVFRLFYVLISPLATSTLEFRQWQNSDPLESSNVEDKRKFSIVPIVGYDEPKKLYAGATLLGRFGNSAGPIDSVSFEGLGPTSLRSGSGAVNGSFDFPSRLISNVEWKSQYDYSSLATDQTPLTTGRVALQANATTRPLKGLIFRGGALLEGGNQQSDFQTSALNSDTLASSSYSSLKLYGGLSLNQRNQALKVSYGIQFGSTGAGLHGDWRKQIGDVAHEIWFSIGDHRRIEVEQQLTSGTIDVLRAIPAGALFFGGNREDEFIPGDAWTIRANPVIRSIPANRFYNTRDGAGAKRFVAYNSNVAITAWRKPLIPSELSNDQEFQNKLSGAVKSAKSILKVTYASDDPNFARTLKILPTIANKLDVLREAVSTTPSPDDCIDLIDGAAESVNRALELTPIEAYGYVIELLPGGGSALDNVVGVCKAGTHDPAVVTAADDLGQSATVLETAFGLIDQTAAAQKAQNDLAYVERALDVIIEDLNISSVSPLFVFDVAKIGPESGARYSGTRYGVGGGIRFALVDTVNLSVGFAANVHRHPGESRGAFFFSLSNRSLFKW
jgi:hypothetical protein